MGYVTNQQLYLAIGLPMLTTLFAFLFSTLTTRSDINQLRTEMLALRNDLHADMANLRDSIHRDMIGLHERLAVVETKVEER
jgi:hypothetical protein